MAGEPASLPLLIAMRTGLLLPFFLFAAAAGEPEMAFIPGGDFLRGRSHSLPDDGLPWFPNLLKDSRPVRSITVDPFYLDRHETTNRDFADFLAAAGRPAPYYWPRGKPPAGKENHPVVNITWDEAAAYCEWADKRLPTEAEWERAVRGLREGLKYPWGGADPGQDKLARYDGVDGPGEVCNFPENAFGLCDMAGNVWEWCSDWYAKDYYAKAPPANPPGPKQGLYRVLRGGSWLDPAKYMTCSFRSFARPVDRSPTIGFRCAADFPRRVLKQGWNSTSH